VPLILLNLFLSMLAAIQAPIIMMSQNRQDAKTACGANWIIE
jgi:CRP/FNR family transcriptional regulator, cyclic AMP receptor protein